MPRITKALIVLLLFPINFGCIGKSLDSHELATDETDLHTTQRFDTTNETVTTTSLIDPTNLTVTHHGTTPAKHSEANDKRNHLILIACCCALTLMAIAAFLIYNHRELHDLVHDPYFLWLVILFT